ncbi:MAG: histidine phosphatase family protein [Sphingomicrobium sp.]
MKTLFVLRHAKASGPMSAATDFDRPLDPRGRAQAADLGRTIRARGLEFGAIVASPAQRVVETIAGLGDVRRATAPRFDPRAYSASLETLLAIIRDIDDGVDRLLLVGHNPGLHLLLFELAQDDPDGFLGQVASGFPTATLAELGLAVDQWREVEPRCGRIVSLVRGQD